jgi:hypothetical protein
MQRQLMMLIAVVPTYSGINGLKCNYSFELELRHSTFLLNNVVLVWLISLRSYHSFE